MQLEIRNAREALNLLRPASSIKPQSDKMQRKVVGNTPSEFLISEVYMNVKSIKERRPCLHRNGNN
jgi:hypothetical protein